MDARLLKNSAFMSSDEFGIRGVPREPLVTIRDVNADHGDAHWPVLLFVEPWAKPLKVNATHLKAMRLMFGDETDRWKGKQIGLYRVEGVWFGERGTAVRIRGAVGLAGVRSFTVKSFNGKDQYALAPLEATSGNGYRVLDPKRSDGPKPTAPAQQPPDDWVARAAEVLPAGKHKGAKISELDPDVLNEALLEYGQQLEPGHKLSPDWVKALGLAVSAMTAERDRRLAALAAVGTPEPGSPPT